MNLKSEPVTAEEVDDFFQRHWRYLETEAIHREVDAMFSHAMDVSFKKWCDDQWARENGFMPLKPQRTYQF